MKAADIFFLDGCGRCSLMATPACKVQKWSEELRYLRALCQATGLTEERKWGVPTYTANGKNIVMIGAFKDHCVLSFLKGALLSDPHHLLEKPSEHSQAGRVFRFSQVQEIMDKEEILLAYIQEAVEVEAAGLKMAAPVPLPIPSEFQEKFDDTPGLAQAFFGLTPGRQRAYLMHFSAPKNSATRTSRIERYLERILAGKGFFD